MSWQIEYLEEAKKKSEKAGSKCSDHRYLRTSRRAGIYRGYQTENEARTVI